MYKIDRKPDSTGFTLIELMVVVAALSLTAMVVVPSMQRLIHSNQLRTESSRLLSALNFARSEAISRNATVSMCPSTFFSGGKAICSDNYADGWIVFSNRNKDRVVNDGSDEIIRVFEGLPAGYTLTNKAGTRNVFELISYLSDGSSRKNRTLMLCTPLGSAIASWSVVMNIVGRPRLAQDWGECP